LLPLDVQMNGEKQITTDITIIQPPGGTKSYIFAPPQPVSFDVAVTLYSDGTTGTWVQQKPLSRGQRYRVVSIMPTSDPQYLTEIPLPEADQALWRADPHYAQLALYYDDIPRLSPNVQKTVRQWVANANDTYTAMKNLERRLSDTSQFTYSIQNPAIPRGANVIDWLLQTRVGYCTYYASAMAIMGRYLHIPTRIVNGFSQGHYDAGRKIWIVEGTDAHTWVQAYFPGYGWIDFDPTPGFAPNAAPLPQATPSPEAVKPTQVPLAPTKAAATATKQEQQSPVVSPKQSGSDLALSHILVVSTLVLSILVLIAALTAYWWHNLYANSTLVSGMFWRLCWIASKAGLGPRSWQTPYEYSSMLSQYLEQQSTPLWSLTELFVRERWGSPHQAPRRHEEEDIQQFWPVLRGMFLQLLFKRKKQL
jgi:transglutaminase-like putative cysteine protease